MPNGKPLFFASVKQAKSYVGFHLMPVYVQPALLSGLSLELRRRMQGKSCFNFTRIDERLFAELDALTRAAFDSYRQQGLVQPHRGRDSARCGGLTRPPSASIPARSSASGASP
jgi:hypothetical protein